MSDKTYTDKVNELAESLDIEVSIAMDILYLRECEARILNIVQDKKKWKGSFPLRDLPVFNEELENFLQKYEAV